MDDKTKARLAKFLELARRGVGGEKENAQRFLARELKRLNLTLDDIENPDDVESLYKYSIKNEYEKLLIIQISCMVLKQNSLRAVFTPKTMTLIVTKIQHLEISMFYSVYRKALDNLLKSSVLAFFHRNNIDSEVSDKEKEENPLPTRPDIDMSQVEAILMGLKKTPVLQGIENKKG